MNPPSDSVNGKQRGRNQRTDHHILAHNADGSVYHGPTKVTNMAPDQITDHLSGSLAFSAKFSALRRFWIPESTRYNLSVLISASLSIEPAYITDIYHSHLQYIITQLSDS